ncbi:hypothetical protein GCM10027259_01580 [Micromonospora palomenae]
MKGCRVSRQPAVKRECIVTSGSMTERIKGLLNSPKGRDLMRFGRTQAAKPSTQQKLRQLMERVTGGPGRRR